MKKTLLATTLLVATGSMAAAEVTLSGSGRFGIVYSELAGVFPTLETTWVDTRLTFNMDAKTETDGGVTFGGRIRFRFNDGDDYTYGNAAQLYMETSGLRIEVGNANGAYDSAGLMYNCEIGYTDACLGDPGGSYAGYSSQGGGGGNMGIFASYSMGDLTARISYHDTNQYTTLPTVTETSVSVDWSANGLSVSAGATSRNNGYGLHYIGAAYAVSDSTNVGLNYFGGDIARIITLYGNHTMASGLTVAGYVTDVEGFSNVGLGVGASYPLGGGAAIKGAYHTFGSDIPFDYADFGVTFSF